MRADQDRGLLIRAGAGFPHISRTGFSGARRRAAMHARQCRAELSRRTGHPAYVQQVCRTHCIVPEMTIVSALRRG